MDDSISIPSADQGVHARVVAMLIARRDEQNTDFYDRLLTEEFTRRGGGTLALDAAIGFVETLLPFAAKFHDVTPDELLQRMALVIEQERPDGR